MDPLQNLILISASENYETDESYIIFSRKIISCDTDHDLAIVSGVCIYVLFNFILFIILKKSYVA